jgi:hypothetical protein
MLEPSLACYGRKEGAGCRQSLRSIGTGREGFLAGILLVLEMDLHSFVGRIYLSDSSENLMIFTRNIGHFLAIKADRMAGAHAVSKALFISIMAQAVVIFFSNPFSISLTTQLKKNCSILPKTAVFCKKM